MPTVVRMFAEIWADRRLDTGCASACGQVHSQHRATVGCYPVSPEPMSAGSNEKTTLSTRRPPTSAYDRRTPSFTKRFPTATRWDRSFKGSMNTDSRASPTSPSAHRETSCTDRVAKPFPLASGRSQYPTLPRLESARFTQTRPLQASFQSQMENVAPVPRFHRVRLSSNSSCAE